MRTDLLVVRHVGEVRQKTVIECELRCKGLESVIAEGVVQVGEHMDRCGTEEGHLVIFDRSEKRTRKQKAFRREELAGDSPVTVWGMWHW